MVHLLRIFTACLLLAAMPAFAVIPEQGIWWNPDQGGRGYGIEVQDNLVYVTYYGYDQNRNATYFTSLGALNPTTGIVEADFATFDGGQCFGCSYRKPVGASLGNAIFRFTSMKTGTITLPGGVVIPIERLALFGTTPQTALLGTWHLTTAIGTVFFGDMLHLQASWNEEPGGFIGSMLGSPGRPVVGKPLNDGSGQVLILEDSSPSYYTAYLFNWAHNRWTGRAWTFLKTSEMQGDGSPFIASRIAGKNLSAGTMGAGVASASSGGTASSMAAPSGGDLDALMALRAKTSLHGSTPVPFLSGPAADATSTTLDVIRQEIRGLTLRLMVREATRPASQ